MPRSTNPPGRRLRPPKGRKDPKVLQDFVNEGDNRAIKQVEGNVQNISDISNILNVQDAQNTNATPTNSSHIVRADGRNLKRTTVYLNPDLHKRLKIAARLTGKDGSTIINELLEANLETLISSALQDLSSK